ncbi:MAG TPA: tRNA guanosine(34) transglycosylase Tgt, partial [Phycisphaerales bacterium]|nr:tRNA guanosine(34) transglycosylase Tgt [Phycisphaerales bacterium]
KHARDDRPIEEGCDCPACDPASHAWATYQGRHFSRAYIRHLIISNEMLGPILVTLHNLRYFQRLMTDLRLAITEDDWEGFKRKRPR